MAVSRSGKHVEASSMRTNLFRVLCAVVLTCAASPLFAQSVMRGKVLDAQGKPVPDAVVLFEAQGVNRKTETKTDRNGDFLQVGLGSGEYKVTASKEGVGSQTLPARVSQGQNQPLNFTLAPAAAAAGGISTADKEAAAKLQALATQGLDHMKAGRSDEAIAAFTEVVGMAPTCADCYYNLGIAYSNKKDYAQAEEALKKAVELKPDHADAYTQLASIYNAQKKFDLASEASANAAKYAGGVAGAGGGSAEATYNQGVILFNSGKFAEAKTQFEAAVKTDPNMAMAHYQLGMTALNMGDFPLAVSSLETYLKIDPNGAKAAEVKASLPALQAMVKK
jgi:tetratricopeptide (TPR) repeat protein